MRCALIFLSILLLTFGSLARAQPGIAPGPQSSSVSKVDQSTGAQLLPDWAQMVEQRSEEVRLALGNIGSRQVLASIPVRYRVTGTLDEPLRGTLLGAEYAPAGTPGFFAGRFQRQFDTFTRDMWCFFPRYREGNFSTLCVITTYRAVFTRGTTATMVHVPSTIPHGFDEIGNSQMNLPAITLGEIAGPPDFRLDLAVIKWDRDDVDLEWTIGGNLANITSLPRARGQDVEFQANGGVLRLREDPEDRRRTIAEFGSLTPTASDR